ncbi:hypothetical protein F2Q69_00013157 [Brassica cretica]|uniref:Uncharacterized protein n=1 Tax=Brassica cretica TaxID=69181 RepID=A0A8S9QQ36_BRACR|nr:hypothetical protein F2Q69_00013157 [Brassica cretica]
MAVLDSPLFVNDCTLVKEAKARSGKTSVHHAWFSLCHPMDDSPLASTDAVDRRCASALDKEPSKEGKDIEKRVGFVLNIPDKALCIFCSWKQTQHRQFQNQNRIEKMVFRAERLTFLYKQIHRLAGVKLALKVDRG